MGSPDAYERPAAEHGRGEEAERRRVAQRQSRTIQLARAQLSDLLVLQA